MYILVSIMAFILGCLIGTIIYLKQDLKLIRRNNDIKNSN